jgi:hypothetical protein
MTRGGPWDSMGRHLPAEGYIYSDSRCYPVIFVNQPAEPVYPDYLTVGAVQGRPGLRGLKG